MRYTAVAVRVCMLALAVLCAAGCATRTFEGTLDSSPAARSQAERLAPANQLGALVYSSPTAWHFSALFTPDGSGGVPLQVLLQKQHGGQAADIPGAAARNGNFEAMLLTETGIGLCVLGVTPQAVTVTTKLPSSALRGMCDRVGLALRHIFSSDQPGPDDARVLPPAGAVLPAAAAMDKGWNMAREHSDGGVTLYRYSPDGVLLEKEYTPAGLIWRSGWRVSFSDHASVGAFAVPGLIRYNGGSWNVRLQRLAPINADEAGGTDG